MTIKFGIKNITFSGGDSISLSEPSTIVIVGPNNSGKTSLLEEINKIIESGMAAKPGCVVIKEIEFLKEGDLAELKRFSEYCQLAFGLDLIVNYGAGSIIPLHIGKKPTIEIGEDRVSTSYIQRLVKLPLLHKQGSGVKSFLGCLLATTVLNRFITLIDEPDMSLHPPQAYLLGKLFAKEHKNSQLFITLHKSDLLRGLLDANASNLNILRMTREGNVNKISKLDSEQIKTLWSDPILQFSNILDGLFHEGVVVFESDGDCKLYAAIFSILKQNNSKKWPDILFVHAGGKGRMRLIVDALIKINVPVRIVGDIDLLGDRNEAQRLFEAFGGDWKIINEAYSCIENDLKQQYKPSNMIQMISFIEEWLEKIKEKGTISFQDREDMNMMVKEPSIWRVAKEKGKDAFSVGPAKQAIEKIYNQFQAKGLFLVPCGELENFDTTTGGHGIKWVMKVFKKGIENMHKFEDACLFVEKFCSFTSYPCE